MQQLAVLERKQDVYNELDDLLSRSGLLFAAACHIHSSLEHCLVLDGICTGFTEDMLAVRKTALTHWVTGSVPGSAEGLL